MPTLDVYKADLHSYVVYKNEIEECDTLRFIGKEFNWFYSLSEAYDNVHFEESGKSHFTIKDYDSTWDQFDFKYKDSKVKGIFDIARYYPDNFSAPIILSSTFILNFEEIIEIAEIKNVSFSVGDFLRFITYRNNYYFQNVELLKKENNSDTYKVVGEIYVYKYSPLPEETHESANVRIIDYTLLNTSLPLLFSNIFDKNVYLKHLPNSVTDSLLVTTARFIMVTAGFEWQYKYFYQKEIEELEANKFKDLRKCIIDSFQKEIDKNTGKEKGYLKYVQKSFKSYHVPLSSKIQKTFEKFDNELKDFVVNLYEINKVPKKDYNYSNISKRLEKQRNDFAHGNIDKEVNPLLVLDLYTLEWLIYVMVLDHVGMSKENIKKSINNLFKRNMPL